MKKIGLLINPHAKKARRRPELIRKLQRIFPNQTNTCIPRILEELSQVARMILDQDVEIIFLFGGDGTLRATIQALLQHWSPKPLPSFVLLQGGTGNLYSKHYTGWRSPIQQMMHVLDEIAHGEYRTTSVNILQVNDSYGFIFAVGGFSRIIQYYMNHKERSITLANWIIFKAIFSFFLRTLFYRTMFSEVSVNLKHGDESEDMKITTLSCSTLPVGYILWPFYGIELNRCFAGLIFARSPFRLFFHLFDLMRKKRIVTQNVQQFTANTIELLFSDPLQPMIDGDMLEPTTKITVKLGPQINFIT